MTDENKEPSNTPETGREPLSPDDLVHMYGGFLYVAVPVALIALIVYLVLR
ncbi:MAG: hypothetical protein KJO13_04680 [Gammaproteobacteria bacterium]|nr:hypothetical protein [Gammaproteobacteria bacterium]